MARRKCLGGCGRWLTSPQAIALGYGPVCAKRHGVQPAGSSGSRRPQLVVRLDDPPPTPIPGQTALPLQPMQPTLWAL